MMEPSSLNSRKLIITLLVIVLQASIWINPRRIIYWISLSKGDVLKVEKSEQLVTIFYNVFFGGNQSLTLSIVREQLDYISQNEHLDNATIQFVLIGNNSYHPNCTNQICNIYKRVESGDEVINLQLLYEHCLERQNEQVIYLHSKGSFHYSTENELLRHLLTRSAVSKECILENNQTNSSNESSSCNICSARFSPMPHWHAAGNMWRASCSYIAKLLPPMNFSTTMDTMVQTAKTTYRTRKKPAPWKLGSSRFSAEHWVHTHPDVIPCDVYQGDYVWGYEDLAQSANESTQQLQLMKAPRFFNERYFKKYVRSNSFFHSKDYRLFELECLYGRKPPNTSWFWSFY
jgi:hypothetical protein